MNTQPDTQDNTRQQHRNCQVNGKLPTKAESGHKCLHAVNRFQHFEENHWSFVNPNGAANPQSCVVELVYDGCGMTRGGGG
jgi:hypothetical protein